MTRPSAPDPVPGDAGSIAAIEQVIVAPSAHLGDFEVRRALPSSHRRMVGPFIFLDQFGPAEFLLGKGLDVRPHPHIGLATCTWMFEGEILHRDSLGVVQPIRRGEMNLMRAGRGVVHSERTPAPLRERADNRLFGIQSWIALPKALEQGEPSFGHYGEPDIPVIAGEGKKVRLIIGSLFGETSPVETWSDTLHAEIALAPGALLPLDADSEERGLYIVSGEIDIAGTTFGPGRLLVFRPGDRISVLALTNARLMLVGGATMDGERHIWWNFVSSDRELIRAAKADWEKGRFPAVPGDREFIPLPAIS